jgi:hypothetical protein
LDDAGIVASGRAHLPDDGLYFNPAPGGVCAIPVKPTLELEPAAMPVTAAREPQGEPWSRQGQRGRKRVTVPAA